MPGSGGGGWFSESPPQKVGEALRQEEKATENQIFETNVAREIGERISEYNDRDADAVRTAINKVRKALENEIEDVSITPVFGGSVRKHTYVNGISDVDSLFVLKGEPAATLPPGDVLDQFEKTIRAKFPNAYVARDNIAMGLEFDGIKFELLPAIRREGVLHISSASQDKWSKIKPESFFAKLSKSTTRMAPRSFRRSKLLRELSIRFEATANSPDIMSSRLQSKPSRTTAGLRTRRQWSSAFLTSLVSGYCLPSKIELASPFTWTAMREGQTALVGN